jgi:lysyl-tRNA synthetase class 2
MGLETGATPVLRWNIKPTASSIGIGIDHLCMMLLGQESIRDVILFPRLKPK